MYAVFTNLHLPISLISFFPHSQSSGAEGDSRWAHRQAYGGPIDWALEGNGARIQQTEHTLTPHQDSPYWCWTTQICATTEQPHSLLSVLSAGRGFHLLQVVQQPVLDTAQANWLSCFSTSLDLAFRLQQKHIYLEINHIK